MKWLVEYDRGIHGKLQIELDENYEIMQRYMDTEIKPVFNRNQFSLWGRIIRVTDKIKKKVNDEVSKGCMFRHRNIKNGIQEIEFKSYIDILPKLVKKPFIRMMTKKIEKPLKKEFGSQIKSVKEVNEDGN